MQAILSITTDSHFHLFLEPPSLHCSMVRCLLATPRSTEAARHLSVLSKIASTYSCSFAVLSLFLGDLLNTLFSKSLGHFSLPRQGSRSPFPQSRTFSWPLPIPSLLVPIQSDPPSARRSTSCARFSPPSPGISPYSSKSVHCFPLSSSWSTPSTLSSQWSNLPTLSKISKTSWCLFETWSTMERSTLTASVCCKTVLDFPPSSSVVVSCLPEDSDSSRRYPEEETGSLLYSHHLLFLLTSVLFGRGGDSSDGRTGAVILTLNENSEPHTMHPHTQRDPRSHSVLSKDSDQSQPSGRSTSQTSRHTCKAPSRSSPPVVASRQK